MINTEKDVVWKPYPEYPFIEANQFGQIRTRDRYVPSKGGSKRLVKGHILKQYLNPGGYLYVQFGMSGKLVNLRVNRVVAICFVPNPLGLPEVNHIDNNPKNNIASNLEWCTHQENIVYREKHGIPAKEATKGLRKPVFAVNLETLEVLRFESQSEAARQLGVDQRSINSVLKGRYIQTGGYWFTENENEITEEKIREIKTNTHFVGGVIAINLKTLEVSLFKSQNEAVRQLEIYASNINKVLKCFYRKTHGYWFCYADENAVEKTRAKFGDDLASEVEKLMV